MRIDKFLSETAICSRTEAAKAAKCGKISVDGVIVKRADIHIDPEKNEICFFGERVVYKKYTYIMLNKPDGYISATDDKREKTVLDLLGERERKLGLFPAGRLDKNTLGLLILTNDGELCHKLLSPKNHVGKTYYFESEKDVTEEDRLRLEKGVNIDGELTKPAKVELLNSKTGNITITEGRFHQIKLMFEAVCNKVIYLERINFAGIPLDKNLGRGEWRELTREEEEILRDHGKEKK